MSMKEHQEVTPYGGDQSKKQQVGQMFDRIAPRYDLLNRVLSLGIDQFWRARLIRALRSHDPEMILDMATGTGDVALAAAAKLGPKRVLGVDIASEMLSIGAQKAKRKNLDHIIEFRQGDAENIKDADNTYDAVTVAFGVRNFENTHQGLKECYRVLKNGGRIGILEFTHPTMFPIKQLYHLYFKYVLPVIGRITSKDEKAYTYLFESVQTFAQGEDFLNLLRKAGFSNCSHHKLTLGICALYLAEK
ncbi:MAG: bifunctional demethylmenaquinone methyltransferase/2-methoxy-6-polyprenyl-1,4-benzoquinol methylase UbiE [Saprospiraceae bacterium]|nr:bifunctional demethylmenaquinone methyltransferase/2-methoxy-6-polyprenyl-1,4-benzoquinol methylase UbiE [Saprospiraceae bacterium]